MFVFGFAGADNDARGVVGEFAARPSYFELGVDFFLGKEFFDFVGHD